MTVITLTGLEQDIYAGQTEQAYGLDDVFGSNNMIYHGISPADVIDRPIVTPGTLRFKADDTTHAENDASIAGNPIELEIPIKQQNDFKYSDLNLRIDRDLVGDTGIAHGTALGEGKTISLMNFLAKTANTATNEVTVDGTSGSAIQVGVDTIMASMDEAKVTGSNRRGLMRSTQFYKFRIQDGVITKEFGGEANVRTLGGNGAIVDYANAHIMNLGLGFGTDWTDSPYSSIAFPSKYAFDMGQVIGIFWQVRSWAHREQEQPTSVVENIPEKQVIMLLSRMQMGSRAIQTDGIWALLDSNSG